MFDTNKIVDVNSIPFSELTLMYLRKHNDTLETPKDYVEQFVKVREEMKNAFKSEWQRVTEKVVDK